ncbi:SanA/YdcF family protein [Lutibacter citreus]|uniref:SanA/YdcF family protein n=1 Tax=Lutibacter citreus TaxID=2138210 RepID=UPI000DBEA63A|nr:ElyC/SanA/YdcF family protein [Lutibacter citreus]
MFKRLILLTSLIVFLIGTSLYFSNYIIEKETKPFIFKNVKNIPKHKVGVVLGTTKYLLNGTLNLYYKYRLITAYDLFKSNKIEFILVSGDNSSPSYNEPLTFKEDLIKLGVPESKIYMDFAGFRTLDSMVRAKEIFGLSEFIVISQEFHNARAIYIGKKKGINAIGFNAKNVPSKYGFKTNIREKFARVKVFIDLFFHKNPKFLGDKVIIK